MSKRTHGSAARRVGRGALGVLVVIGGLATAVGCSSSGGTDASLRVEVVDDRTPAEVLAQAADSAATVQSGRMRATMEYDFVIDDQSANASLTMEGGFTDQGRRSEFTADMGAYIRSIAGQVGAGALDEVPGSMVMRIVQDGTDMYMKFDVDPPEPGTEYWYVTDLAESGLDASQIESPVGLGGGVTGYAESLRGAGADVAESGTDEIDGVEVTRFEGTLDPAAAIDRAAPEKRAELRSMLRQSGMTEPMPFVAWVDDDGVLRRMQMTVEADVPGVSIEVKVTADYFDFGADITITPPPADLVRDASELTDGVA